MSFMKENPSVHFDLVTTLFFYTLWCTYGCKYFKFVQGENTFSGCGPGNCIHKNMHGSGHRMAKQRLPFQQLILYLMMSTLSTFSGVDTMEKGALVGMMGLATSDFLFCLITMCGTFQPGAQMIYHSRNFVYYYTLYGNCIHNVLIKTSTWFTVILAVCRHFVVSHPITARQYMRCGHTLIAIGACVCFWVLLNVPLTYLWNPKSINCKEKTIIFLKPGAFQNNEQLKSTFSYLWFITGFAVPVCILAFCNIKLIYYLRKSTHVRGHENLRKSHSSHTRDVNQRRISLTLVVIISMFFLLVLPSEIMAFYVFIVKRKKTTTDGLQTVLTLCHMFLVLNFAANFGLYCIVNAYFRKTLAAWIKCYCLRSPRPLNITTLELTSTRKSTAFVYLSMTSKQSNVSRKNVLMNVPATSI